MVCASTIGKRSNTTSEQLGQATGALICRISGPIAQSGWYLTCRVALACLVHAHHRGDVHKRHMVNDLARAFHPETHYVPCEDGRALLPRRIAAGNKLHNQARANLLALTMVWDLGNRKPKPSVFVFVANRLPLRMSELMTDGRGGGGGAGWHALRGKGETSTNTVCPQDCQQWCVSQTFLTGQSLQGQPPPPSRLTS
jgi:hypothetical protein